MIDQFEKLPDVTLHSPLFQSSGFDESVSLGPFDMQTLPPFLRSLMVADGTVTKLLEAYFWEPVDVQVVSQQMENRKSEVVALNHLANESLLMREVRLVGRGTRRVYAKAISLINPKVVPDKFLQPLKDEAIGVGALIGDFGLESYREVLAVGEEKQPFSSLLGGANQTTDLIFRAYRIFIDIRPAILIYEYFPLSLYR